MSTATIARTDKRAAKFREMAERLESEIEGKRASRRENTPKQQKEAACQRIDADHLQRVKDALEKLADASEHEGIPVFLAGIKSKAQLLTMLRTRLDTSGGYYSIRDTGEYPDQSEEAIYLRAWLASRRSQAERERDAEAARQSRIRDLEAQVKFSTIPGFFPTPLGVIELMLHRAQIEPGMTVLEPSAGKGDIADAIRDAFGRAVTLVCIECNYTLHGILLEKGHTAVRGDFLEMTGEYDRIVMNPPFENLQDIDHVRNAYQALKPGGRLVSVMSPGPFYRQDRKATEFREWFGSLGGEDMDLPNEAFKDAFRSTSVRTKLVVIDKP